MKKLLLAMSALAALSLLVPSTGVAQSGYNQIGIFTSQDADPASANYNGAPGNFTAYVVIINPRNYHVGDPNSTIEANITRIGGYEFKIVVPAGVFVLGATLPPTTVNFHPDANNYFCGTNLPVTNGVATCVTMNLGAFTQTEGYFYMAPVNTVPTFEGYMALTDFNDDFRENLAHPASGSFDAPVFALWPSTPVVPTEEASWGELKTLFR